MSRRTILLVSLIAVTCGASIATAALMNLTSGGDVVDFVNNDLFPAGQTAIGSPVQTQIRWDLKKSALVSKAPGLGGSRVGIYTAAPSSLISTTDFAFFSPTGPFKLEHDPTVEGQVSLIDNFLPGADLLELRVPLLKNEQIGSKGGVLFHRFLDLTGKLTDQDVDLIQAIEINGYFNKKARLGDSQYLLTGSDASILTSGSFSVPEPSTFALCSIIAGTGMGLIHWRCRRNAAR